MAVRSIDDIDNSNAPTPVADVFQHVANLGEFLVLFSVGVGASFAALHYRSLEVVLGFGYAIAIAYLVLQFEIARRATAFRMLALTLGVILGYREIILMFPLPLIHAVLSVVGAILLCLRGYKWLKEFIG